MIAVGESEGLGIAAVKDHGRRGVDPIGEKSPLLAFLRLSANKAL
jgi:hypothetical protein